MMKTLQFWIEDTDQYALYYDATMDAPKVHRVEGFALVEEGNKTYITGLIRNPNPAPTERALLVPAQPKYIDEGETFHLHGFVDSQFVPDYIEMFLAENSYYEVRYPLKYEQLVMLKDKLKSEEKW